jgi:methylated-DNA-protein-cysteine methyltransferase-like protein
MAKTSSNKKASKVAPKKKSSKGTAGYERVFEQIYRFVLRIPRGRVMTYGQIARLLGDLYSPRLVGWAMHATPQDGRDIPWHRVINSRGSISTGHIILHEPNLQLLLLEAEGVEFDERGRCDLALYQWSPPAKRSKANPVNKISLNRQPAKGGSKAGSQKKEKPAVKKKQRKN